jgi:hypothetical protein
MQALYAAVRESVSVWLGNCCWACWMHLVIAASLVSCAEACDARAATESATGNARRYLLMYLSSMRLRGIRETARQQPRRRAASIYEYRVGRYREMPQQVVGIMLMVVLCRLLEIGRKPTLATIAPTFLRDDFHYWRSYGRTGLRDTVLRCRMCSRT